MDVQVLANWLALMAGAAGALSTIVSGLMAFAKTTAGDALPARYYPTISVALGVAVAEFVPSVISVYTWREGLLIGVLAGLIASKLFDYGKERASPQL